MRQNSICLGSSLSMRSFPIDEPGSRTLYHPVWGLPLMEWLKGPMGPALNKSLSKHQHHQVYLPTSIPLPCTWSFYPALASQTVQDLTSSDLSSLHRLLFEAETRTRYEIYLYTSNNGFRSLLWINI